jgi:hypothetical protein
VRLVQSPAFTRSTLCVAFAPLPILRQNECAHDDVVKRLGAASNEGGGSEGAPGGEKTVRPHTGTCVVVLQLLQVGIVED